jgi:hypothetical protein
MAAHYHHTWRRTMIPTTVSLLAFLSVLPEIFATYQGERVPGFWLVFTPWVLSCGLAWIFSPLTVEVSGTEIRWYFGPGFWDHRVVLSDVESVRIVRNTWLNRFMSGDTVELRLTGDIRRIGTDDPQGLAAALKSSGREVQLSNLLQK